MAAAAIDATHAPGLRSWVDAANHPDTDFPIQNLPLGCFRREPVRVGRAAREAREAADTPPQALRAGVAIGDQVLDLRLAAEQCPWADEVYPLLEPLARGDIAAFMRLGRRAWRTLRHALSHALAEGSDQGPFLEMCLVPQAQAVMAMPCRVGDFTDFNSGIHHAWRAGALRRPEMPLLPNYRWLPIAHHGRASSIGVGGALRRPRGQVRTPSGEPVFGPSQRLDYELELGLWVGTANALGEPVEIDDAEDRLFGVTLLNDWSARDIQAWEYQPLGPFLSKSFATSVSPWIVSFDALAPFRRPHARGPGDPQPMSHLDSARNRRFGAIEMTLEAWLQTEQMRSSGQAPVRLAQSSARDAYWTASQLVAHHTSNGCNLQPGDLIGTGALAGPRVDQGASLLELTQGGKVPLRLPNDEERTFLEDGDTIVLRAYCSAPGAVRIGLGEVSGTVVAAR